MRSSRHGACSRASAGWTLSLLVAVALAGCAAERPAAGDEVPRADAPDAPTDARRDAPEARPDADGPTVHLDGRSIVLVTDEARQLAVLDPADGEPLHVSLRPGDHEEHTVLVLTRVQDDAGARYELRYLVVDGPEVSDLYWFPWRLQVDEEVVGVLDVPPVPVWSPDGGAVAWIEWAQDGTRLRTVGWYDDERSNNPSDDAHAYALREVPPGAQLRSWEAGDDGTPVLLAEGEDDRYLIELGVGLG